MTTLITLACLAGCLLMLINQLRMAEVINEQIIPAVNQCDADLDRLEQHIANYPLKVSE